MITEVILVVFFFSLIQSLFGVGLLVFGTPTLLLLGLPFETVLAYLLPTSATISLLQIRGNVAVADLRHEVLRYCVPGVILGLTILVSLKHSVNLRVIVGALLLLTAGLRSFVLGEAIQQRLRRHSRLGFAFIGLLHGFTNMGGGLLSILVSSLSKEKLTIRSNIAFAYLVMALSQILVLVFVGKKTIPALSPALMLLGGVTYLVVGRQLFAITNERVYQRLLTAFVAVFGLSLVAL